MKPTTVDTVIKQEKFPKVIEFTDGSFNNKPLVVHKADKHMMNTYSYDAYGYATYGQNAAKESDTTTLLTISLPNGTYVNYQWVARKDQQVKIMEGDKAEEIIAAMARVVELKKKTDKIQALITSTGGDPEFFVMDEEEAIIPAFRFLPDKKAPLPVYYRNDPNNKNGAQALYWDGLQAEFTVSPGHCHQERTQSIRSGLLTLVTAAKKICPKAAICPLTVIEVDDDFLASTEPKFLEFGCAPSFNVYGMSGELGDGKNTKTRSTGGHIHFGLPKNQKKSGSQMLFEYHDDEKLSKAITWLDYIMALSFVSFLEGFDNPVRRQYYGLPGEYRKPVYKSVNGDTPGLEYRTLSNAYMLHPIPTQLALDLSRQAANCGLSGLDITTMWQGTQEEVIKTIINADAEAARKLMEKNKELFSIIISRAYGFDAVDVTFNALMKPMSEIIKEPLNVDGNWCLSNQAEWDRKYSNGGIWWRNQYQKFVNKSKTKVYCD